MGYAYASPFRTYTAYNWVVETTIYVKQGFSGAGIGSMLYSTLEKILKEQGVTTMIACIAYPPPKNFHEAVAFQKVDLFSKSSCKLSQWVNVVWMEKHINKHKGKPSHVVPFSSLK